MVKMSTVHSNLSPSEAETSLMHRWLYGIFSSSSILIPERGIMYDRKLRVTLCIPLRFWYELRQAVSIIER